jgi:hypothetical protein
VSKTSKASFSNSPTLYSFLMEIIPSKNGERNEEKL